MTALFTFRGGDSPLLVSIPHAGTFVPEAMAHRMTAEAAALPDTDWHVDRLYDFLEAIGASAIVATHSRYVADLNRPPDDVNLYPGQDTTELVPMTTFDRAAVYRTGQAPDAAEIAERRELYWRPYHERIAEALAELKARHGAAILFDAHSIRSVVPRFFDGRLPDLNLGTAAGKSAAPALARRLSDLLADAPGYTRELDGRFKGGYITRHYGRPHEGVNAVQLEISQATYMDEAPPYRFDEAKARRLRLLLRRLLETLRDWR